MLGNILLAAAYAADRLAGDVLSPMVRACHRPRRTAALTGCPRPSTTLHERTPEPVRAARVAIEAQADVHGPPRSTWLPAADLARAELARQIDRLTPVMTDASQAARVTLSRFLHVTAVSERPRRTGAAVLLGVLLLASCVTGERTLDDPAGPAPEGRRFAANRVERLRVKVLASLPHDPKAFTQGLEMAGDTLYEGTGISGRSSVRAGRPGERPTVRAALPAPLFGEGVTVLGRTLWQLTWQNRTAIERDVKTLAELRRVPYPDDGWGVCLQRDRRRLVTSDGSSRLTFRDPRTLAKTGEVAVTEEGRPVTELNELECVAGAVYANVLFTDRIVRIDPATGAVTASIDASGLLREDELVPGSALNGIAAVPGTDQFLVTGKFWPRTFRVAFVPA